MVWFVKAVPVMATTSACGIRLSASASLKSPSFGFFSITQTSFEYYSSIKVQYRHQIIKDPHTSPNSIRTKS